MDTTTKRQLVRYELQRPIIIDQRNTLDSLLAWVAVQRLLTAGLGYEQMQEQVNEAINNLPIAKVHYGDAATDWVYAASSISLPGLHYGGQRTISKSTNLLRYMRSLRHGDLMTIASRCIERPNGIFKGSMPTYSYWLADVAEYICDVPENRIDEFRDLVARVSCIGKKRSIGFGLVRTCSTADTDKPLVRPLPYGYKGANIEPVWHGRLTPPYWEKTGRSLCAMGQI